MTLMPFKFSQPSPGVCEPSPKISVLSGRGKDHPDLAHLLRELPLDLQKQVAREGFCLYTTPERILMAAETSQGARYGAQALSELLQESKIPCGLFADWPTLARRGLHLLVKSRQDKQGIAQIITEQMPKLRLNELILEINYGFTFQSHPEVAAPNALTREDCREICDLAAEHGIRLIPMLNCLGHQSWAGETFALLKAHPEFDETPETPADNADIYCRSWCPSHPDVNGLIFDLIDELMEVFDATAFHAGMDEVFVLGQCPRCRDTSSAQLFAGAVNALHQHIVGTRGVEMLIWADRFLDAEATGYGVWEASGNGTAPAVALIPHDIVLCDWHYETEYQGVPATYPSIAALQDAGFTVWPAGWNSQANVRRLLAVAAQGDSQRLAGYLATTWVGVAPIAEGLAGIKLQPIARGTTSLIAALRTGAELAWTGQF
jgi:hypothetical protein